MMSEPKYRIAEIFGPTIQGEGRSIGTPCFFVRLGGCDFRCRWCDTPHAVLPEEVAKLKLRDKYSISGTLHGLASEAKAKPEWVVLTGGNPGLIAHGAGADLIAHLNDRGWRVMVETQGSTWRDWYLNAQEMCFSPKPPSSGMVQDLHFLDRVLGKMWVNTGGTPYPFYLKVVVFDDEDYEWAMEVHKQFNGVDFFLSVGNEDPSLPTVGNPRPVEPPSVNGTRHEVLHKMKWLMEKVANDKRATKVRVLPQMHVLAWGNERGR